MAFWWPRSGKVRIPAANNPHLGNKESIRSGMAAFRVSCGDCHGLDAGGYRGPDLVAFVAGGATDERLFDTIRKGVPGTEMPAQGLDMSDNDILQIIAYLRNLGSVAAPETPIGNAEHGQRLFAQPMHDLPSRCGPGRPDRSRICRRVGVTRSRAALTREIRTPSEWMAPTFETVTLVTRDGQRIRGVKKAEDVFSIQIMDTRERLQGYLKANLQEVIHDKNSLMPVFGTGAAVRRRPEGHARLPGHAARSQLPAYGRRANALPRRPSRRRIWWTG